jgi:antitoxin CptB
MEPALDPRAFGRLKWRCRRGLLENDLFIERFFAQYGTGLTRRQAQAMESLMTLADNDLLDLLLRRTEPTGELARPDVHDLLAQMRRPAMPAPH